MIVLEMLRDAESLNKTSPDDSFTTTGSAKLGDLRHFVHSGVQARRMIALSFSGQRGAFCTSYGK